MKMSKRVCVCGSPASWGVQVWRTARSLMKNLIFRFDEWEGREAGQSRCWRPIGRSGRRSQDKIWSTWSCFHHTQGCWCHQQSWTPVRVVTLASGGWSWWSRTAAHRSLVGSPEHERILLRRSREAGSVLVRRAAASRGREQTVWWATEPVSPQVAADVLLPHLFSAQQTPRRRSHPVSQQALNHQTVFPHHRRLLAYE